MKNFILIRAIRFLYFNFFKKIFFIDYLNKTVFRSISIFINNGISVVVNGNFNETNLYSDYFFRINWYLKPIDTKINKIYFNQSFEKFNKTIPKYLNQNIKNHLIDEEKIHFNKSFKKKFYHNKYNYAILNCTSNQNEKLKKHELLFNSREETIGALNSLKFGEQNFNSKIFQ